MKKTLSAAIGKPMQTDIYTVADYTYNGRKHRGKTS